MKQTITHYSNESGLKLSQREYDVLSINAESLSGEISLYLAEAKKIRGRHKVSNKSKNPFPHMKIVSAKSLSDQKFLSLAKSEDENRPEAIQNVHSNWAADGFRLHKVENGKECSCKFCKNKKLAENGKIQWGDSDKPCSPQWEQLFPLSFEGEISLDRNAILDACNQVKVFAREGSNLVKLEIYDTHINFIGTSEEYGSSITRYDNATNGFTKNYQDVEYTYAKSGIDLVIAFNVDFVLDAVKSMGEKITIKYNGKTHPAVFTDGNRTCLLMPMLLG